jgi:hypothetical protein
MRREDSESITAVPKACWIPSRPGPWCPEARIAQPSWPRRKTREHKYRHRERQHRADNALTLSLIGNISSDWNVRPEGRPCQWPRALPVANLTPTILPRHRSGCRSRRRSFAAGRSLPLWLDAPCGSTPDIAWMNRYPEPSIQDSAAASIPRPADSPSTTPPRCEHPPTAPMDPIAAPASRFFAPRSRSRQSEPLLKRSEQQRHPTCEGPVRPI